MASRGLTCPYCKKYSSVRTNGRLYVHKGNTRHLVSSTFLRCLAGNLTFEQAQELRKRVDAGQKAWTARANILQEK